MSGDAGELPQCEVTTLITLPSWCAALGMVESELVSLPGSTSTRGATQRPRFVVFAAGWLYSRCCTDAVAVVEQATVLTL